MRQRGRIAVAEDLACHQADHRGYLVAVASQLVERLVAHGRLQVHHHPLDQLPRQRAADAVAA